MAQKAFKFRRRQLFKELKTSLKMASCCVAIKTVLINVSRMHQSKALQPGLHIPLLRKLLVCLKCKRGNFLNKNSFLKMLIHAVSSLSTDGGQNQGRNRMWSSRSYDVVFVIFSPNPSFRRTTQSGAFECNWMRKPSLPGPHCFSASSVWGFVCHILKVSVCPSLLA